MNAANPENVAAAVPVSQPAAPPAQAEAEDEPAPPAPFGKFYKSHLSRFYAISLAVELLLCPLVSPAMASNQAGMLLTKPLPSPAVQSCHLQSLDQSKTSFR